MVEIKVKAIVYSRFSDDRVSSTYSAPTLEWALARAVNDLVFMMTTQDMAEELGYDYDAPSSDAYNPSFNMDIVREFFDTNDVKGALLDHLVNYDDELSVLEVLNLTTGETIYDGWDKE